MKSQHFLLSAGNLHSLGKMLGSTLLFALLLGTACFIPPPYADEFDANPNYPPVIKSATPSMPGPVTLTRGNDDPYTLTVEDKDLDDTLYLRVFRDYTQGPNTSIVIETQIGSSDEPTLARTFTLPTNSWCNGAAEATPVFFDIVVADRPYEPLVDPINRAVQAGGETAVRSWFAQCLLP